MSSISNSSNIPLIKNSEGKELFGISIAKNPLLCGEAGPKTVTIPKADSKPMYQSIVKTSNIATWIGLGMIGAGAVVTGLAAFSVAPLSFLVVGAGLIIGGCILAAEGRKHCKAALNALTCIKRNDSRPIPGENIAINAYAQMSLQAQRQALRQDKTKSSWTSEKNADGTVTVICEVQSNKTKGLGWGTQERFVLKKDDNGNWKMADLETTRFVVIGKSPSASAHQE